MNNELHLGILGCAEIAQRRFMPAVKNVEGIKVTLVGEQYAKEKLDAFTNEFGIEGTGDFYEIICNSDIDAVYIPQPPALHFEWAKAALENGKHVLVEKPSTIHYENTKELVDLARKNNLALHENYMFVYHSQIAKIIEILNSGIIGDCRLYRANFGFPMRSQNDFRYNKALGGGALLDAGGYTVKLATILLGNSTKLDASQLNGLDGYEVDMYGNATFSNDSGMVFQAGFGMDCAYQCNLEVWGSKGILRTNRIFTAPADFTPTVQVENQNGTQTIALDADSHFEHSIETFVNAVKDNNKREEIFGSMLKQAELIEQIRRNNS